MTLQQVERPSSNPFVPHIATLKKVTDLTPDILLFNLEIDDPGVRESFTYRPGQFAFVSAFGIGEAPFGISSVVHRKEGLEFAIRKVGTVTRGLHELEPGEKLGVRGPMGNYFPLENYKGKNILIIGGGIGMAPLRPVINTVIDSRDDYGQLTVVNGARSPRDLVFAAEFETWAESPNSRVELTVDRGDPPEAGWTGRVALVPSVVTELNPSPENTIAITCGPPIMIHFVLKALKELSFAPEQIVTTLESKMKCGLGKCARCNVGSKYVCVDGPVFSLDQLQDFLEPF